MNIIIHNVEESEPAHLAACIERVKRWDPESKSVLTHEIHCNERKENGWAEYAVRLMYYNGQSLYAATIQREPGAQVEFHS